jgi:Transposase and inactivated derivatives
VRPTKEVKQYYYSQIQKLQSKFAVNWLCEMFQVSRSGYYKWLNRGDTLNCYQRTQIYLDELVMKIHTQHPTSGYRAINARIRQTTGWVICNLSVLKSMQRLHIRAKGRKNRYTGNRELENERFPNILNRQFTALQAMQKVVTDITQFRYRNTNYHFVCFLDLFNNEILEWNVSKTETMDLILPPLRRLLKQKKKSTENLMLLHSDQGFQYSSAGYVSLLKQYNVIQSMSRAGTPRDNAVIESIFGWFKDFLRVEYLHDSSENIVSLLTKAVHEFNFFRPSHKLNYLSPVQFRRLLL